MLNRDPLDQLGAVFMDVWDRPLEECGPPSSIVVPFSTYLRIGRLMMTKRRWRRWRAKAKAQAKRWAVK